MTERGRLLLPEPKARRVLGVLAALTSLAPLSIDIYTPSILLMQADLGGADWLSQASITACLLGIAIGQLVCGPLSDGLGRRPVVLVGVVGWTLASLLSALAVSPVMLIAARVLVGVCGAAGIVVARSIVRDITDDPPLVASRVGLLSTVTAVMPVIAPLLGAGIAAIGGWRADFVALAMLGAVLALVFAGTVPESLPRARRDRRGTPVAGALVRAARVPELAGVALAIGAYAVGFYAYVATASFVVEREYGHSAFVFALVFGTNALAMLAANLVFRRIVRRWHPSGPLGIGLVAAALSGGAIAVVAALGGPEWALWAISAVFAASAGFILPGAHSWAQLTVVASGAASALTGATQFFGGVLGSPLTGLLGTTAATLGAVIALSSGAGVAAWAWASRERRTRQAREA